MSASSPEDLHKLFATAVNDGNLEGIMALYERDAAMISPQGAITAGYEAIRQSMERFLALKGRFEMQTLEVIRVSDLALLRGEWRLAGGTGPEGQPVDMAGRGLDVARQQQSGGWRFVIDLPFGPR
jgi:uncharacterized protein (TIGR02246 family)